MPSPLATQGDSLSRAKNSLYQYYGMGRNFLQNIQSPEHQARFLDYTTATPERLTQFGQHYASALGEVTPESQAKYDDMLVPMRGALALQSDLNDSREQATGREIDRLRRETTGMTPEQIDYSNSQLYDENGYVRGTEPAIRARLRGQAMDDARNIYEGRSENIPYDQNIMNRAREGAIQQENQDYLAGKPGMGQNMEGMQQPADTNNSITFRNPKFSPYDALAGTIDPRTGNPVQRFTTVGPMSEEQKADYLARRHSLTSEGRKKMRVNRTTGEEIRFGEDGYDQGVDISTDLFNQIQRGEKSPDMIRAVIRQQDRQAAYRARQGGMSSALAKRLRNKDRALRRSMRGNPIYNKKGKLIGRRAPVIGQDDYNSSMLEATGGRDWLAGAGRATGADINVPEPAPITSPLQGGGSMALIDGKASAAQQKYWNTDAERMQNRNRPEDIYARDVVSRAGLDEVPNLRELNAALNRNEFDEGLESVPEGEAHKQRAAIIRKIRQVYAEKGEEVGGDEYIDHVQKLEQLDTSDPEAVAEWFAEFRTFSEFQPRWDLIGLGSR